MRATASTRLLNKILKKMVNETINEFISISIKPSSSRPVNHSIITVIMYNCNTNAAAADDDDNDDDDGDDDDDNDDGTFITRITGFFPLAFSSQVEKRINLHLIKAFHNVK